MSAEDAAAVVRALGRRAERVDPLGGVMNEVHRVRGPRFDWVVRLPVAPTEPSTASVEAWAIGAARAAGLTTPAVVAMAEHRGAPCLVLEYLAPDARPIADPWRRLGELATEVARIPLHDAPAEVFSRFGSDLPGAWRAHLRYNVDALAESDPLIGAGAYPASERSRLRELIAPLSTAFDDFGLVHGDLAPRNLLSHGGAAVLIDWGAVTTGPVPWISLQSVYEQSREDPGVELDAFAAGVGVPITAEVRRTLRRLTVLRALDLVRWARERRPDVAAEYAARSAATVERELRGRGDDRDPNA